MEAGGNSEMVYSPPLGDAEKRLSIVQCIIIGNFEKTGKPRWRLKILGVYRK